MTPSGFSAPSDAVHVLMNGVIAMADLLLDSPLDADQRECAEIIRDSSKALVGMVNTEPAASRSARSAPPARNAPRVLVVDDSHLARRVAERMVARSGYRPHGAESGPVGVNLSSFGVYAAILMDCGMSEMDGFTAAAEIRRDEEGQRRTPIIAMIENPQPVDRVRCLAAGMDDCLSSPLQMAELADTLGRWISAPFAATAVWADMAENGTADRVLDAGVLAQLHALEEPGEPGLLTELIEAFRMSAPARLARLRTTLAAGDASAFGDAAHALKCSAATLGAARLRFIAYDLELRGRDDNLDNAAEHLTALAAAFTEALEALSQEDVRFRQDLAA